MNFQDISVCLQGVCSFLILTVCTRRWRFLTAKMKTPFAKLPSSLFTTETILQFNPETLGLASLASPLFFFRSCRGGLNELEWMRFRDYSKTWNVHQSCFSLRGVVLGVSRSSILKEKSLFKSAGLNFHDFSFIGRAVVWNIRT